MQVSLYTNFLFLFPFFMNAQAFEDFEFEESKVKGIHIFQTDSCSVKIEQSPNNGKVHVQRHVTNAQEHSVISLSLSEEGVISIRNKTPEAGQCHANYTFFLSKPLEFTAESVGKIDVNTEVPLNGVRMDAGKIEASLLDPNCFCNFKYGAGHVSIRQSIIPPLPVEFLASTGSGTMKVFLPGSALVGYKFQSPGSGLQSSFANSQQGWNFFVRMQTGRGSLNIIAN